MDPEKVYWDANEEIYVHSSVMCYDPGVQAYYTIINQKEGDLRPLYYLWYSGDFMLVARGNLEQSIKIVMEDRS